MAVEAADGVVLERLGARAGDGARGEPAKRVIGVSDGAARQELRED